VPGLKALPSRYITLDTFLSSSSPFFLHIDVVLKCVLLCLIKRHWKIVTVPRFPSEPRGHVPTIEN